MFATGNVHFRALVKKFQAKYFAADRVDKPQVAAEVVAKWRQQNPPGRFLIPVRTNTGNAWNDVGDRKARQKTSQALRERACRRTESVGAVKISDCSSTAVTGNSEAISGMIDVEDAGSGSDSE